MSNQQIHKRLDEQTVAVILERYLAKEISSKEAMQYLGVQRSRFFEILKSYQDNIDEFTLEYQRASPKKISDESDFLKKMGWNPKRNKRDFAIDLRRLS